MYFIRCQCSKNDVSYNSTLFTLFLCYVENMTEEKLNCAQKPFYNFPIKPKFHTD